MSKHKRQPKECRGLVETPAEKTKRENAYIAFLSENKRSLLTPSAAAITAGDLDDQ